MWVMTNNSNPPHGVLSLVPPSPQHCVNSHKSRLVEMVSSGINLVTTVIGFVVSTMFIVFVCTRLICARIQHSAASRRRAFPAAPRAYRFAAILERRMNGLEPVVVANFPTKNFGDKCFSSAEETQCAICLSEYQENDILRVLPYCGHAFHITCIDIWLRQHSTCPVCRVSLHNSPDRKHIMNLQYSQPVRSPCSPRFFSSYSYHQHVCPEHEHSSRTTGNQDMELIHEDHPEASGARETVPNDVAIIKESACLQGAQDSQNEKHLNL